MWAFNVNGRLSDSAGVDAYKLEIETLMKSIRQSIQNKRKQRLIASFAWLRIAHESFNETNMNELFTGISISKHNETVMIFRDFEFGSFVKFVESLF